MPVTLYQFPVSHYCEKVRFALEYKGVEHQVVNLLPGPHIKTTRTFAQRSHVPLLVTQRGEAIQGSSEIISYLDDIVPEHPLTPAGTEQRDQALRWEYWMDNGIGIEIRRYCYHYLLPERRLTTRFLTHNGPWYGQLLLLLGYGKLSSAMRQHMDINEQTAAQSLAIIEESVSQLADTYSGRDYLVGDSFSRADLAAAALLAPLFQPAAYGLPWPEQMPAPLQTAADKLQPDLAWAQRIYRDHRH
jgi:glutathione S-transferase